MSRYQITSQEVVANRQALARLYFDRVDANRRAQVSRAQLEDEERILLHRSTCPIEGIRSRLEYLEPVSLKKELTRNFADPSTMKSTSCIVDAVTEGIFYGSPDSHGGLEIANSITNWFVDLKGIGVPSSEGFAMVASFKNTGGMAVIKVAQDPKNTEFVHEMFLGIKGTNSARKDIPNFAYIYGGFKCSSPVVDDGKVISICANKEQEPVQYIIYENVAPAKSVEDSVSTLSPADFLSAFFQILLATHYGHQRFDWTHYDLHVGNVLLREVEDQVLPFYIRYPYQGRDIYVKANRVATIIDYGRSHIKYKERDYGYNGIEHGVFQDRSFPMFDIYKFLMFSAYICQRRSCEPALFKLLEDLYSYFNSAGSLEDVITDQQETYYTLPFNAQSEKMSIPEYLTFITKKVPVLANSLIKTNLDPQDSVLGCSNKLSCKTVQEIYSEVGLDKIEVKSIIDLYDQTIIYIESDRSASIDLLYNAVRPNYDVLMNQHVAELEEILGKLDAMVSELFDELSWFSKFESPSVYETGINLILDPTMMLAVKRAILKLARGRFLSQRAALYAIAGKSVASNLNSYGDVVKMDSYLQKITAYQEVIKKWISETEEGLRYIQSKFNTPEGMVALKTFPELIDYSKIGHYI